MKLSILILGLLTSLSALAESNADWLKLHNPMGYFPDKAKYVSYSDLCNANVCFDVVAVSYVTETKKGMRRVAVFSATGEYLGVYSGFQEMPEKVVGSSLLFPESEYGNIISFGEGKPPATVYIDGENFDFESKP